MKSREEPDSFELLSVREMQGLAALCFAEFCVKKRIVHTTINELIEHLLYMLVCESLVEWEGEGSKLELVGRGDPIPEALESIVPDNLSVVFSDLVEFIVEVGIVDMYGRPTERPLYFLRRVIDTIERNGVLVSDICSLYIDVINGEGRDHWGKAIAEEKYGYIIKKYKEILEN